MKLGLQIPVFTWPGGAPVLGAKLAEIVRTADDAGYASIWVMDHHFQIEMVGRAEMDMLEAYTTLGFIAAHTSKARLGTMVTGVTYRHPGILAKQVTTLDVLSGGRAYLGIGAAWFEREHVGLGVPFPPISERFRRLEEALQIAKQMWSDNNGRYDGKYYQLAETLNSPQALSKPHPPILIGGAGEKKTLRLVAQYGDACNLFAPSPAFVAQKLAVLKRHCEDVGRNYDDIEKTIIRPMNLGEGANKIVQDLGAFAEIGVTHCLGHLVGVENVASLEVVARDVMPQIAKM
jgi:F420-dependent oxidoreductase-like protein